MKNLFTILSLSLIILFTNSCKKDDDNRDSRAKNLSDLHDTLVGGFKFYSASVFNYDLDLDKDLVSDLLIEVRMHWSPSYGSEFYIKLTPRNGFEMALDSTTYSRWGWNPSLTDTIYSTHTVPIPKTLDAGDVIPRSLMFSDSACYLYYRSSPGELGSNYTNAYSYHIVADNFTYLAFRKKTGSTPILAWLKLKYPGNDGNDQFGLVLNSCRYSDDSDELVIY